MILKYDDKVALSNTSMQRPRIGQYFRYGDNSVYLNECSPFWVDIFITFNKETTMFAVLCRPAHSD